MGERGAEAAAAAGATSAVRSSCSSRCSFPCSFALGAIVLDVGNWYVHKRHLQTQVDAAALAGATKFVGCSFQFGNPVAANQAIKATALTYAGDMNRDPATSNLQLQEPIDVHAVLNGARYWDEGDPVDDATLAATLDNTFDPDGDPATPGTPCETKTLDVKATEHDAPLLWGLLPATPSPKTKAKVEIRQIREQMRMLPFAVPEIDPAAVVALFVDEDAAGGEVVDWQHLGQLDDPRSAVLRVADLRRAGGRLHRERQHRRRHPRQQGGHVAFADRDAPGDLRSGTQPRRLLRRVGQRQRPQLHPRLLGNRRSTRDSADPRRQRHGRDVRLG